MQYRSHHWKTDRAPRVSTAATAFLIALAACGTGEVGADKLEDLAAGMPRDSVLARLGPGPLTATGSDTLRVLSGYRVMRYLVNGKQYTVLYAREAPGDVRERVSQTLETPVVFDQNDRILGWGWRFYVDEAIAKLALPTPLIDTVTTPPAPASNAKTDQPGGRP